MLYNVLIIEMIVLDEWEYKILANFKDYIISLLNTWDLLDIDRN